MNLLDIRDLLTPEDIHGLNQPGPADDLASVISSGLNITVDAELRDEIKQYGLDGFESMDDSTIALYAVWLSAGIDTDTEGTL